MPCCHLCAQGEKPAVWQQLQQLYSKHAVRHRPVGAQPRAAASVGPGAELGDWGSRVNWSASDCDEDEDQGYRAIGL
jgi:hypothetical protein